MTTFFLSKTFSWIFFSSHTGWNLWSPSTNRERKLNRWTYLQSGRNHPNLVWWIRTWIRAHQVISNPSSRQSGHYSTLKSAKSDTQVGFEPTTFSCPGSCSNHWATGSGLAEIMNFQTVMLTNGLFGEDCPLQTCLATLMPLSWPQPTAGTIPKVTQGQILE